MSRNKPSLAKPNVDGWCAGAVKILRTEQTTVTDDATDIQLNWPFRWVLAYPKDAVGFRTELDMECIPNGRRRTIISSWHSARERGIEAPSYLHIYYETHGDSEK